MRLIDLNGAWRMKRADESGWTAASVPGSVYADLLRAGRMEDPFFRDNEAEAMRLSDCDYEYRRDFSVEPSMLSHEKIFLLCEGLDTLCDVFLNGEKVLSASNMHRTYEADVKKLLLPGKNAVRVLFHSPIRYLAERQKELPLMGSGEAIAGYAYLRKAHCMFGWDWGPKLPDMGIWRSISIRGYDAARIDDVLVTQRHAGGTVGVTVRTALEIWDAARYTVRVRVTAPDGSVLEKRTAVENGAAETTVEIDRPQLWWPNNMGGHPLYKVEVFLAKEDAVLDEKSLRIGLRTLTVERKPDEYGESFAFTVNGVPFFAMGADYIPEDSILSRCSRSRTARLIQSCVEANFNVLRVWGGGYYPEDYFYDLCDENGIVVWQDLMFACSMYLLTDSFRENISAEAAQNVRRLRHHASLGLWSGNNEMEVGWAQWGWNAPEYSRLKADYIRMFEILLPGVIRENDPVTSFWPSSPSSGGCFDDPNGQDRGDMHYWDVWHGCKPFTAYRGIVPRFMSEFGIQSFPGLKTVETFTLPEDRNIFSYVMESHQKSGTGNEKILYYISQYFRYPKDFDSLLYVSQLIQAEGIRYGVEHWRRNRGRCMGTVFWQLNDCWPVASWASVDYCGRWKALQYAAKRFFSPVMVSACEEGTSVPLFLTNDTMREAEGEVRWRLTTARGDVVASGEEHAKVPALASCEALRLDFAKELDTAEKRRRTYLDFRFVSGGETVSRGTVSFVPAKHFSFENPKIAADVRQTEAGFAVSLTAESFARFVELRLAGADAIFSDNFFDLSAGESREIFVRKEDLSRSLSAGEFRKELQVRSLFDSYEH